MTQEKLRFVKHFNVDGIRFSGEVTRLKTIRRNGLVTVEVIGNWPFRERPPNGRWTITLSQKYEVRQGA